MRDSNPQRPTLPDASLQGKHAPFADGHTTDGPPHRSHAVSLSEITSVTPLDSSTLGPQSFPFEVCAPPLRLTLAAQDAHDRDKWVSAIKARSAAWQEKYMTEGPTVAAVLMPQR